MYNVKDIQFVGKYDYDKQSAEHFASWGGNSFSIGIFQWLLKSNGKEMKRGKVIVRIHASPSQIEKAFETAEEIIRQLDAGKWTGKKSVTI